VKGASLSHTENGPHLSEIALFHHSAPVYMMRKKMQLCLQRGCKKMHSLKSGTNPEKNPKTHCQQKKQE